MTALLALCSLAWAEPPLRLDLETARPTAAALDLSLDPKAERFSGAADLDFTLEKRTRSIRLNATDLVFAPGSVTDASGRSQPVKVTVRDEQSIALRWSRPLSGPVRVHLSWTGPVSALETQGVFRQQADEDWYLFTQFEATDARRAFPFTDQPDAKVPWTLTLRVPDEDGAFSNMPEVETTDLDGPLKAVRFAPTPPLPSYLVTMAVGPFAVLDGGHAGRADTPIRLIVPHAQADQAGWALEATPGILATCEDLLDLPLPFPKLDIAVVPKTVGWGAMENPGLITMVAATALARPEDDTLARRRQFAEYIAHEIAHFWFGDLVTPRWWDDLWLNESLATWMSRDVLDAWQPDWNIPVEWAGSRSGALSLDALSTARQIRQPIESYDDIANAFDGITYGKGAAVLTMFEGLLGADRFRGALRAYLEAHAHGNATADDLMASLDQVEPGTAASFRSFLDQPGAPLVELAVSCEGAPALTLQQTRFRPPGSQAAEGRWSVPVCWRWADEAGEHRQCSTLSAPSATVPLEGATGCPTWLVPTAEGRGYYRSRLDEAALARLLDPTTPLPLVERVTVISDAAALVSAGRLPPSRLLAAVPDMLALDHPQITGAMVGVVGALNRDLVPDDLRPAYQAFIRDRFGEAARRLGLAPPAGEDPELALLRPELLDLVGGVGEDPAILDQARPLAEAWLTSREGVAADLVPTALSLTVRHGDQALFDRIRDQAVAESDPERREILLNALGSFRDPALARQAIALASTDAFDVRESFGLFLGPLSQRETRDAAWDEMKARLDTVEARVPVFARAYLSYAGTGFCDAAHRADVEATLGPRAKRWAGGPRVLAQVLEGIALCAASAAEQAPAVRTFLSDAASAL